MARFGFLLVALIAITGWIVSKGFTTDADKHAIVVSGVIATVVQLIAFALVQLTGKHNATLIGWIMGTVVRGFALVLYGLLFAKLLGLPLAAALTSFAVFLFASMLLESFLISYAR
jgi:predicted outer membrane lipoprotein